MLPRIVYTVKLSFNVANKIEDLKLHHQHIHIVKNIKGSSSGRRKMAHTDILIYGRDRQVFGNGDFYIIIQKFSTSF